MRARGPPRDPFGPHSGREPPGGAGESRMSSATVLRIQGLSSDRPAGRSAERADRGRRSPAPGRAEASGTLSHPDQQELAHLRPLLTDPGPSPSKGYESSIDGRSA